MSETITIRKLSEDTQRRLKHRAVDNGRSFEAEIRAILDDAAVAQSTPNDHSATSDFFEAAAEFRKVVQELGVEFPSGFPNRIVEYPRELEL